MSEELNAKILMAEAEEVAGLSDFGDDEFVEPLTRWLDAAAGEAKLTPLGVMATRAHVQRLLVNRLRFQDDLIRHPEIQDENVSDPVVIVGLGRSGTTKLQRMMSCDPALQGLPLWQVLNPAPLPEAVPGESDPRIAVTEQYVRLLNQQFPEFAAGHSMGALEPEEEVFLLEMTFESDMCAYRARVPSYAAWWHDRSRRPSYAYLRRLLQYLQWQGRQGSRRPFVLKSPVHLGNLDVLFETFPNATVVACHRDPRVTMASGARMVESTRRMMSDEVDLEELGDVVLNDWAQWAAKSLLQRDELDGRAPILDVRYADIVEDPLTVIRSVCTWRNTSLSPEAESRMLDWDRANPRPSDGRHEYSLERYGLNVEKVAEAFAPYLERFAIEPEGS